MAAAMQVVLTGWSYIPLTPWTSFETWFSGLARSHGDWNYGQLVVASQAHFEIWQSLPN
ncbi:hypothetical protein LFAB_08570 [Lactiplantibacillus fabifermentans T30PCM01]|uniref:Uncharacterized protein n=2 Tax=Lactiplantibacillus fabifermentans TaxID=483011 RepID=A0A0R2NV48_9LACO|nr:hypothetical protein LFAB_08570 [Lactiplantibacillus fabifermentans T30PCM01]KRO28224.1 hypothetical protein DY78_GL002563 [Lactiplantibacillus fabifermentans DSM 21115]